MLLLLLLLPQAVLLFPLPQAAAAGAAVTIALVPPLALGAELDTAVAAAKFFEVAFSHMVAVFSHV